MLITDCAERAQTNTIDRHFHSEQLVLANIRTLEHTRTAPSSQALARFSPLPPAYAWNATSAWDLRQAHDPSTAWDEHGAEPWRTELRHYQLAYNTVLNFVYADVHRELSVSLVKHRQRIADSISTSVAATNPTLAARLLVKMDRQECILRPILRSS